MTRLFLNHTILERRQWRWGALWPMPSIENPFHSQNENPFHSQNENPFHSQTGKLLDNNPHPWGGGSEVKHSVNTYLLPYWKLGCSFSWAETLFLYPEEHIQSQNPSSSILYWYSLRTILPYHLLFVWTRHLFQGWTSLWCWDHKNLNISSVWYRQNILEFNADF